MKKIALILVAIILITGVSFFGHNVYLNKRSGWWSESCGTIFTNPHHTECVERRYWIERVPDFTPKIFIVHGGDILRIEEEAPTKFAPVVFIDPPAQLVLACGRKMPVGQLVAPENNEGLTECK